MVVLQRKSVTELEYSQPQPHISIPNNHISIFPASEKGNSCYILSPSYDAGLYSLRFIYIQTYGLSRSLSIHLHPVCAPMCMKKRGKRVYNACELGMIARV